MDFYFNFYTLVHFLLKTLSDFGKHPQVLLQEEREREKYPRWKPPSTTLTLFTGLSRSFQDPVPLNIE